MLAIILLLAHTPTATSLVNANLTALLRLLRRVCRLTWLAPGQGRDCGSRPKRRFRGERLVPVGKPEMNWFGNIAKRDRGGGSLWLGGIFRFSFPPDVL
jgi:hypothetical protein